MNPGERAARTPRTAADLCEAISLSPKARPLLVEGQKPVAFLGRLVDRGHYIDALRFLTQGMLPRQAVWWACLCLQQAEGDSLSPPESAALLAAVAWILNPSAANRESAYPASREATLRTPAGCAARAAYWCGSTPAPDQPLVLLRADLAAKLAGASVLLAAARCPTPERNWTYRQFIALALDVDCGRNPWPEKGAEKAP